MKRRLRLAALLPVVAGLAGCSNLGYYLQAAGGQMEVLGRARPIRAVLEDPNSPERLKRELVEVERLRRFASTELGLPDNGTFRRYADLQRPFVVWNVFAAEAFSVKPKSWCYLLVGCADYRGYFSPGAAREEAERLRRDGYDVYVAGIAAYSTLGWFDDPVLNTVIDYPLIRLAPLIFHELAHQVAYARDDTTFNESFAVAVELEGTRRWLERFGSPEQKAAFAAERQRRDAFEALVGRYRGLLDELYGRDLPMEAKRAEKARLLAAMTADYERLKASWGGFAGYDKWFAQPLNNAQLASVSLYTRLVPAFQALLQRDEGDLARFYRDVKALAALPAAEREADLRAAGVQPAGGAPRRGDARQREAGPGPVATSSSAAVSLPPPWRQSSKS